MQDLTKIAKVLRQKLAAANYHYAPHTHEQLLNYLLLLDKWNHTYNLTSIRDVVEMIPLHILDSLAIAEYVRGQRVIDIGTGAGLPGMPLAIVQADREFILLDSNGKKTRFLTHVVQQLNLSNVKIVQKRAEHYQTETCFATIVSRAFSELNAFLQKTRHLCCKDGQFLAMKGHYPHAEIARIDASFQLLATYSLQIPELNAQRHLICLGKKQF